MSDYYFDGQGFENPSAPPSAPPSLNSSSVEAAPAVRRNFRMSSKTVARHTLCISYRDSDCDLDLLRGVHGVAGGGHYIVCVISQVTAI